MFYRINVFHLIDVFPVCSMLLELPWTINAIIICLSWVTFVPRIKPDIWYFSDGRHGHGENNVKKCVTIGLSIGTLTVGCMDVSSRLLKLFVFHALKSSLMLEWQSNMPWLENVKTELPAWKYSDLSFNVETESNDQLSLSLLRVGLRNYFAEDDILHSLFSREIQIPSFGLRVTSLVNGISSSFILVLTLNFLRTDEMTIFSFIIANFCPIQFLGPAENGTYE